MYSRLTIVTFTPQHYTISTVDRDGEQSDQIMLLPRYCCTEHERFRLEGENSSLWVTVTWVVFLVTGVSI